MPPLAIAAVALAGAAIAAVLFFVVLRGDDGEAARLDPAKADELAAAAMFSVGDLPGSGWRLTNVDSTEDSVFEEDFPSTEACDRVAPAFQAVVALQSQRAGRAQRSFERAQAGPSLADDVEVEVSVYPDARTIASAWDGFKKAVESDDFSECLGEFFSDSQGRGTATTKKVAPYASPPSGGVGLAYEVDIREGSNRVVMRFELYYWRFANAVAFVGVIGDNTTIGEATSEAAVTKLLLGLEQAASSNPPTAVPAVVATTQPARSPVVQATARGGTPVNPLSTRPAGTPASQRFGKLSDLNSYKSNLKIGGSGGPLSELAGFFGAPAGPGGNQAITFEVEGTYVKPDRGHQVIKVAGLTITQTTIGRQQWSGLGGIVSGPETITPVLDEYSLAASLWEENFLDSPPQFACSGRETVNGVATRKCGIDSQTFDAVSGFIGPFLDSSQISSLARFSFEVWLAEAGDYPVRVRLEMAGKDAESRDFDVRLDLDITDINSSSNRVEPPR